MTAAAETHPQTTISPHDGPQHDALASTADIVIFGGANGGGKTWALCYAPLQMAIDDPGFRGVMFRRTIPQAKTGGGLLDETKDLYRPTGAELNRNELRWSFPTPPGSQAEEGAHVQLRGLQYEGDEEQYDGAQLTYVGFDQLEQFGPRQFFYLLGRLRSVDVGWEPFCFATCNPAPRGHWLYEFVKPWLDDEDRYPDDDEYGRRRWFFPEGDGGWRWVGPEATETIERPDGEMVEVEPMSVEFYPATVFDNPSILEHEPRYVQRLNAQHERDRLMKLHGAWGVSLADGPLAGHQIQIKSEADLPSGLSWVRYWDLADTEKSPDNPNPSHTAGVKAASFERQWTICGYGEEQGADDCRHWEPGTQDTDRCPACGRRSLQTDRMTILVVADAVWFQMSGAAKKRRMVQIAKRDGRAVTIGVEQEPGATGNESARDYEHNVFPDGHKIIADRPTGDKFKRLEVWAPLAATGRLWVVDGGYAGDYIKALEDLEPMDVIDATGGAYKLARRHQSKAAAITTPKITSNTPLSGSDF